MVNKDRHVAKSITFKKLKNYIHGPSFGVPLKHGSLGA
jgi:hypothetical protein